jgi:hypothetical protein
VVVVTAGTSESSHTVNTGKKPKIKPVKLHCDCVTHSESST